MAARSDHSADLVEEVARIEGYDAIEAVEPAIPAHAISSAQYDLEDRIASTLAGLGYHEIVTYALQGTTYPHKGRAFRTPAEPRIVESSIRSPRSSASCAGRSAPASSNTSPKSIVLIASSNSVTSSRSTRASPTKKPRWHSDLLSNRSTNRPGAIRTSCGSKATCEALLRAVAGIEVETARDVRGGYHPGKSAVAMWQGREVAAFGKIDPRLSKAFDVRLPLYLCNIYLDRIPEYQRPVYRPPSRFPVDVSRSGGRRRSRRRRRALCAPVVRKAIGELCTGVARLRRVSRSAGWRV